jgi:phage baseplate assembly protein W
MPIPSQTYRVNPLDLQPNVAVGVGLPFNKPGVFTSTFSTKDQTRYNIINFVLTNKGERIENPTFGSDIKKFLFEAITDNNLSDIEDLLGKELGKFFPEIVLLSITATPSYDNNTISLQISYKMALSGDKDNININFQS